MCPESRNLVRWIFGPSQSQCMWATFTFSPAGLRSSNGIGLCVCACVHACAWTCTSIVWNELICGHANVVHTSSLLCLHTHMHAHTNTHSHAIWAPRTPTVLEVGIAHMHTLNVCNYVHWNSLLAHWKPFASDENDEAAHLTGNQVLEKGLVVGMCQCVSVYKLLW